MVKTNYVFDAIICWLIGTHGFREFNDFVRSLSVPNQEEYRLAVQNTVFEISNELLRKGGVLHIVDRGECPKSRRLKKDLLDSFKDQASVTSLVVKDLDYRKYQHSIGPGGVKMVMSPGQSGRIPKKIDLALLSIRAYKP